MLCLLRSCWLGFFSVEQLSNIHMLDNHATMFSFHSPVVTLKHYVPSFKCLGNVRHKFATLSVKLVIKHKRSLLIFKVEVCCNLNT